MTPSNNRPTKRTLEISIRLTEDERQRLHERKTEVTLAGWLRNLGLGATPIKHADPSLVRALGRIGSNLNQIAKHANTDKTLDQNVLTEIRAIRAILADLAEQDLRGDV